MKNAAATDNRFPPLLFIIIKSGRAVARDFMVAGGKYK